MLVVTAHPDDVDFGVRRDRRHLRRRRASRSPTASSPTARPAGRTEPDAEAEMAEIRQDEQRAAAAAVGVHDVTFLGYPDGRLAADDRAAPRHHPGDPPVQARSRHHPVARAQLGRHLRQPPGPPRRRRGRGVTPSTPTPATRSPTPSSSDEGLEPHTVRDALADGRPGAPTSRSTSTDSFDRKVAALRVPQEPGRRRPLHRGTALAMGEGHGSRRPDSPRGAWPSCSGRSATGVTQRGQLAQHVAEDPAVAVVLGLHRRVDPHDRRELDRRCRPRSVAVTGDLLGHRAVVELAQAGDREDLVAGRARALAALSPAGYWSGRTPMPIRLERWMRS